MTETNASGSIPAGWYPDPAGSAQERWWDGTQWTSYLQDRPAPAAPAPAPAVPAPASAAPAPAAPDPATPAPYGATPYGATPYGSGANAAAPYGAGAYAPAIVQPNLGPNPRIYTPFLWVIVLLPLLSTIALAFFNFGGYLTPGSSLAMLADPSYLLITLLGWVIYGVSVWFAFLDRRVLERVGIVRPFHWAWAFLGGIVYVIGRSVVLKRRIGVGTLPAWIMGAVYVVSFIIVMVKVIAVIAAALALYNY